MAMKCMMAPSESAVNEKQEMKKAQHKPEFGISGETKVPDVFKWPKELLAAETVPELKVPHIDLEKFISGNESDVKETLKLVDEACKSSGFFVLVNHGVDMEMMKQVHECMNDFFELPLNVKQKAQRHLGESYGYTNSFIGRFKAKLPWKETFSCRYLANDNTTVRGFVTSTLGPEFSRHGEVYQEYGRAMSDLCMRMVELMGMSLGLPKETLREFYEDNDSIVRLNFYPACEHPELTLGTGPHCDPTSITILHQDHVSGLQVSVDGEWYSVPPTPGSFVVNIGDTFMALTNGVYKSCFHRAVVNSKESRKSLAFFLCPSADKLVRAPEELVEKDPPRKFPDFTWPMLLESTQKFYRADSHTFDAFSAWVEHRKTLETPPAAA